MLIKEYRIPLPLSLEEYRIAQLFMIQKKSRLESTASDSAIEIIENSPYTEGPGGDGQYTKKIYHIGSHLPGWLKSILPKTALRIEEEAWNAYPYTKTRYSCPFIEKFFIDIETHYMPDYGQNENVFNFTDAERKIVEVDCIDPVKDDFPPKEYKEDEDPHYFISKKTGRGPLSDDWLEKLKDAENDTDVMCAYKIITVEFKYWGMQSKIENFIQNGLRNPMLVGHRQAWSWQDEWYGLTIEDIRQLEKEAQLELSRRIDELNGECVVDDQVSRHIVDISSMSASETDDEKIDLVLTNEEQQLGIHMKRIEQSESDEDVDDDLMYFDALETFDDNISISGNKDHKHGSMFSIASLREAEKGNQQLDNEQIDHAHILIFVVQAGSIADYGYTPDVQSKDFETFKDVFYYATEKCYPGSKRIISIELISCPLLSVEIMEQLKNIHCGSQTGCNGGRDDEPISSNFPFSLVPILITQSLSFQNAANEMVKSMNDSYHRFVSSLTTDTNSEVYVLADCIGGLLLYRALTQTNRADNVSMSGEGEENPVIEDQPNTPDFDFIVSGIFFLGSPIGLVAFNQKLAAGEDPPKPHCGQIYNLFHPFDPLCFRLEPIIDPSFNNISPLSVPRHQSFPYIFDDQSNQTLMQSAISMSSMCSAEDGVSVNIAFDDGKKRESTITTKSGYENQCFDPQWWGTKRIDYILGCPEGLHQFPISTLVHLCYNSYWESKDLVTFILWQILNEKYSKSNMLSDGEVDGLTYLQPIGKWLKKRTSLKIKNMSPNHRVNDAISICGAQPVITGKFAYGPVDMVALTGENVDVYIKRQSNFNEWKLVGSEITDSHGRLLFNVPTADLEAGLYSVKMVVRGDHSNADCNMAILPRQSEVAVFSIDGSFLASISLSGINPKIRGGAVDAVRHWQELGYFIIYVSSRLLFQKYQVTSWLSEHNFPFGIVSFCDTVSTNYQKHKINFLKNFTQNSDISIHVAYGSSRDIPVYVSALNLPLQRVFLLGKKSNMKKLENAQWITNGYAAHLSELKNNHLSKRSSNNKNILLSIGNFGVRSKSGRNSKKKASNDVDSAIDDGIVLVTKALVPNDVSDDISRRHLNLKERFSLRKTRSNPPMSP